MKTIHADDRPKNSTVLNKKNIIIGSVIALAAVAVFAFVIIGINSPHEQAYSDEVQERIAHEKENYRKTGIVLEDSDFIIDEEGNVSLTDEAQVRVNNFNNNMYNHVISNIYGDNDDDNDNENKGKPKEEKPNKPKEEDNKQEIIDSINKQLSLAKNFMDRSLDEKTCFYFDVLQTMIDEVKNGNGSGSYDFHDDTTNQEAFEVLCGYIATAMVFEDTETTFDSYGVPGLLGNSVMSNYVLSDLYKNDIKISDIDVVYEDSSKSYKQFNEDEVSEYVVCSDGYKFILGGGLTLLDVER